MKLFHKHKWVEKERFYAPPDRSSWDAKRPTQEFLEAIFFGLTTILYECQGCGKLKTVKVIGQSLKEKTP